MDLFERLEKYGKGVKQLTPDRYRARPINFTFNAEGVKKFNEIYMMLKESDLGEMERTPNGGISKDFWNNNTWDYIESRAAIEITVYYLSYLFVFRLGRPQLEDYISGWRAFQIFSNKCSEFGIDIYSYQIENGLEVKEDIPNPLIFMKFKDKTFKKVNHIDFHSSYPAGLVNTHPEFRPVVEYFYEKRKEDPVNKGVLNCTIGFMQSVKCCKARWAHLSKDAITDNLKRIQNLAAKLALSGHLILGYNTDGIWYQGELYHGEGEGDKLGEWSNDHINCQFRAKSDGAYEFIENGKYTPVLRGFCNYDTIKSRDNWEWGDIYKADCKILNYTFNPERGVELDEEDI